MVLLLKVVVFSYCFGCLKHQVLIPGIKTGCGNVLKPLVFCIYSRSALDTQPYKKGLWSVLKPVVNGMKPVVKGIKTYCFWTFACISFRSQTNWQGFLLGAASSQPGTEVAVGFPGDHVEESVESPGVARSPLGTVGRRSGVLTELRGVLV